MCTLPTSAECRELKRVTAKKRVPVHYECESPCSEGASRRVLAALSSQVAELQKGSRRQGGLSLIFPWGPEVDELACRVGGSGDGKEPVEVIRQCVNKVRSHYGLERSASAKTKPAGGGASQLTKQKRAALMEYYKNGDQ